MRLHSDSLSAADLNKAARYANVGFTRLVVGGSRSHSRSFDVILTGSSNRRQNGGEGQAATWDEWGEFLGYLFQQEPNMLTTYYADAAHFHWATGDRFNLDATAVAHGTARPYQPHPQHTFENGTCACGAVSRHMTVKAWKA